MNKGLLKGLGTQTLRLDNKRIARAADPIDDQDVETRYHMRGATAMPPPYFPASSSGHFDPLVSMHGWGSADLHLVRSTMKKLATSVAPMHIFFLGDSTLIGYNGTLGGAPIGYNSDRAIPRQFGLALSYMLGGIPYTDGVRQAVVAITAPLGDRTTLTGSFSTNFSNDLNLLTSTGAGTAKWSSIDRGTTFEFYYSDLSTSGFTYSIDGAAPVSVTTGATSTIKKVTVSGLADTPHNILITTTGAQTWITGWRVYSPALVQLHCHNLAIGGTKANSIGSAAGSNWSDATATGLQTSTTLMMGAGAANITPDLVVVCCGNNDAGGAGVPAEQIIKGLQNMRAIYPSTPYIFIHPPMVSGSDPALFDRFSQQFITMIDGMSATTYFSWDDWDNRSASYIADGLAGADGNHPIDAEAMAVARHLATELAGPETYSTPMTSQALIANVTTSGTAEQITYQIPIPSWFWHAAQTTRVVVAGTCTSGTTPTLLGTCRIGVLGTTSDASVCATAATAGLASGAGWRFEVDLTCVTVGTSGTVIGKAVMLADAVSPKVSATTTAATVNTNTTSYLNITLTPGGTTPVFVQRMAYVNTPQGP